MIKTAPGTRHIIFGMVFLLSGLMGQAHALTVLSSAKDIALDTGWHATGHYTCVYEAASPDDVGKLHQIIGQVKDRPDKSIQMVIDVRLPDGSSVAWEPVTQNDLPPGTRVSITVDIAKDFPGFEGLFADTMHINQGDPIKYVSYRIQFPRRLSFIRKVVLNHKSREDMDCADRFTWSGKNVSRLDIFISTAISWEQVTRRYQSHFQERLGGGLLPSDLPIQLGDINPTGSPDEKIRAVLCFLNSEIVYRRSPGSGHALLPDPPLTVLQRKWGDCKDFALLATALLRAMDIETFVVLTGKPRNSTQKAIPDPFIFDHALVGFDHKGQTTYYDCTTPEPVAAVNKQQIYLPLKMFENDKILASITHCDIPITY